MEMDLVQEKKWWENILIPITLLVFAIFWVITGAILSVSYKNKNGK